MRQPQQPEQEPNRNEHALGDVREQSKVASERQEDEEEFFSDEPENPFLRSKKCVHSGGDDSASEQDTSGRQAKDGDDRKSRKETVVQKNSLLDLIVSSEAKLSRRRVLVATTAASAAVISKTTPTRNDTKMWQSSSTASMMKPRRETRHKEKLHRFTATVGKQIEAMANNQLICEADCISRVDEQKKHDDDASECSNIATGGQLYVLRTCPIDTSSRIIYHLYCYNYILLYTIIIIMIIN